MFTPSILTILGVIMYLRLPRIVGEGGLYLAIGIILAAHLISVTTGLSVSSIATDKRVEAGGAYYIVSRSMGLAIGGTLGLALFVGLSFSISLYIIGFSESFLAYFALPTDLATIRICGTITLVMLTVITFVSTSLAIRAQYVILGLIAVSLLSIFLGGPDVPPEQPHLMPLPGGQAATTLFGIFFPAVTGFTAGVNMSGDLQDPRRAIPLGTVAAIAVGLLVYVGLAVFMAFSIPADQLVASSSVLVDTAFSGQAVVGGIWGATISSALGSILGAPRILQALSQDQITPRVFAIGQGESNEPRYALLLAFVIGEAGIMIGELDAIARIVSVFFIATYGFLNLSASFEMIASPDFRPDFRIPRWVPVLGAVACAVLMIWLDLLAMLGAVVVLSALFFLIKRRELQLETGDTLLGVWSSVVRHGLHRLTRESAHQRNWLPNILLFTEREAQSREPMLEFGHSLIRHRGVATEFLLVPDGARPAHRGRTPFLEGDSSQPRDHVGAFLGDQAGFFHREVVARGPDPYETMSAVCRFHGFSGLEPNTVMFDWHAQAHRPDRFAAFLAYVADLDFNVAGIAFDPELGFADHQRIDLWWSPGAGSLPFNLALVRFITTADEWRRAELRFFVLNADSAMADSLHKTTTLAMQAARVVGQVKVLDAGVENRSPQDWILQYSARADLVLVGLPNDPLTPEGVVEHESLARSIGTVLFVRASSQFESGAVAVRGPTTLLRDKVDDHDSGAVPLRRLRVPRVPDLVYPARAFADEHGDTLVQFCDRTLSTTFGAHAQLLERIHEEVQAHFRELEGALHGRGARGRTRLFRRAPERALRKVGELIAEFAQTEVDRTTASVERGIDEFLDQLDALEAELPGRVDVVRDPADFAPSDTDPGWLRRFKTRRRWVAAALRRPIRTTVRPGPLLAWYLDVKTLELARHALSEAAGHTLLVADDLGRFLSVLKDSLAVIQARGLDGTLDGPLLASEADRVTRHIEGLVKVHHGASERQVQAVLQAGREQQQAFADDLVQLNLARYVRRERRVPREARELPAALQALPERWAEQQSVWLGRAGLICSVGLVQTRLARGVGDATRALRHAIEAGPRARCTGLLDALELAQARLSTSVPAMADVQEQPPEARGPADAPDPIDPLMDLQVPPAHDPFDVAQVIDGLQDALKTATVDVPIEVAVVREQSLQALATDPLEAPELVEVPLRRQLQFMIEAELVGPIKEIVGQVPRAEQRATSTAEDVVRLVLFAASDTEGDADELPQAIQSGIERVQGEVRRLDELAEALDGQVGERLDHVVDLTNGLAILGTAEAFEAHGRRHSGADLGRLGRFTERLIAEARSALVTLAYRRSAGVLLARRIAVDEGAEAPIDGVLSLVDACTPDAAVLAELPSYYVQLFSGQSALHSAFWVGRDAELERIRRGIEHYDRGFHGAVVVIGEPGSGRTGLCEVAIERFLRDRTLFRIVPPAGGSADPEVFRATLQAELPALPAPVEPGSVDLDPLLAAVPDGSVLLFRDVELWWERSPRGLAVLDQLTDAVEAHGDRLLFFVEMGRSAFRFVERYSSFGAGAVARVEVGPVDAEVLKEIAILRHNSSGLGLTLEGRDGEELSAWALAQLFTAHFDLSDGNVGAALHSWLAHIEAVHDNTLVVRMPRPRVDDAMDHLSMPWVALLLQLVLHKQLSVERMLRITGLSRVQLMRDLAALRRTGLVSDGGREILQLVPRAQHLVLRSLRRRGMLP